MLFGAGIVRAAKEVELAPLEWRRERNLASSGLALQVDLTRLAMKDALLGNEIDGDVLEVRQPVPLDGWNGKERSPDVSLEEPRSQPGRRCTGSHCRGPSRCQRCRLGMA